MDAELEFAIQPNTTGKQLFDQVSSPLCNSPRGVGRGSCPWTVCQILSIKALFSPHHGIFHHVDVNQSNVETMFRPQRSCREISRCTNLIGWLCQWTRRADRTSGRELLSNPGCSSNSDLYLTIQVR